MPRSRLNARAVPLRSRSDQQGQAARRTAAPAVGRVGRSFRVPRHATGGHIRGTVPILFTTVQANRPALSARAWIRRVPDRTRPRGSTRRRGAMDEFDNTRRHTPGPQRPSSSSSQSLACQPIEQIEVRTWPNLLT